MRRDKEDKLPVDWADIEKGHKTENLNIEKPKKK